MNLRGNRKSFQKQTDYINQKKNVQKQVEKKKSFLKIFLGIAVSMLVVILLGCGLVYKNIKDIIIDQNIQMSMQAFSQVQSEFEEANEMANKLATQVLLDDVCTDFLNTLTDQNLNTITISRIRYQLSLYQNTNPIVESIYIYNQALDLFVASGTRFKAEGKDDFADRSIVEIMKQPEKNITHNLIRRELVTKYQDLTDKGEIVYSYVHYTSPGQKGNVVVINMKFESMIQNILEREMMKDSRMLVIDDEKNRLVDLQTTGIEETLKLKEAVLKLAEGKKQYCECTVDGEKYFISYLYSKQSEWNYVKVTQWNTIFQNLRKIRMMMFIFGTAISVVILVVALVNSLSILKLHGTLEKKYASAAPRVKRSDMNVLKEGFLNNFLHSRKLYGKNQLHAEMEKFGFSYRDEQKFTLVILKIEAYDKFREIYGKKATYDIKYGFQNIFAETFEKEFRLLSLINRDDTLTFVLEPKEEEGLTEKITAYFHEFCKNSKVFVEWEFQLFGMERTVPFEKLPELNAELKTILPEGFFYESNRYLTYEQILLEHGKSVDFQQLDGGNLTKKSGTETEVSEYYQILQTYLKSGKMTDYMNTMTWLGITISRDAKKYMLQRQESNDFLVQLTKCEKVTEVDELFQQLFETIREKQENTAAKKGVTGKLSEVKRYIEEHFQDQNLSLEQLGDEFSVSPNYLGRLFKKETGMSVADYINGERLKWVLKELEQTDRPAKEIAEECGFASSNYFYTYFRKKIGLTPQAYREQSREKEK